MHVGVHTCTHKRTLAQTKTRTHTTQTHTDKDTDTVKDTDTDTRLHIFYVAPTFFGFLSLVDFSASWQTSVICVFYGVLRRD